jgi:hypothetical protein
VDFGIKCATVCACDWTFIPILVPLQRLCHDLCLVISTGYDVCNWHSREARDVFYPVDNSRDLAGTWVHYYPATHRGQLCENLRVRSTHSPIEHTNQFVVGNQRTTVILKQTMRTVKIITIFTLGNVTRNWWSEMSYGLNCSTKSHQNQTTSVSVNVWGLWGNKNVL